MSNKHNRLLADIIKQEYKTNDPKKIRYFARIFFNVDIPEEIPSFKQVLRKEVISMTPDGIPKLKKVYRFKHRTNVLKQK